MWNTKRIIGVFIGMLLLPVIGIMLYIFTTDFTASRQLAVIEINNELFADKCEVDTFIQKADEGPVQFDEAFAKAYPVLTSQLSRVSNGVSYIQSGFKGQSMLYFSSVTQKRESKVYFEIYAFPFASYIDNSFSKGATALDLASQRDKLGSTQAVYALGPYERTSYVYNTQEKVVQKVANEGDDRMTKLACTLYAKDSDAAAQKVSYHFYVDRVGYALEKDMKNDLLSFRYGTSKVKASRFDKTGVLNFQEESLSAIMTADNVFDNRIDNLEMKVDLKKQKEADTLVYLAPKILWATDQNLMMDISVEYER